MKNTKIKVIIISIVCVVLLFTAWIVYSVEKNEITYNVGTCIVTDAGHYLVVFGDCPTSMSQRFGGDNIFSGLETGDKIGVVHGYIGETYPAKTSVYFCRKLADGEPSDVSPDILKSLNELGWKVSTDFGEEMEVQEEEIPDNLNVETFLWEDLDGNGIQEYVVVENGANHDFGRITFYFNDEPVYRYEEELDILNVVSMEYIDLDNDDAKEVFVSFAPNVNSAGLMEWFVLKQATDGTWKIMNDISFTQFPISITKGANDFELVISCEGTDKEILFDATDYYDWAKREAEESYDAFVNGNYKDGDEVGYISAYGILHIEVTRWGGQDCLVAVHGLQGPGGKHDIYGAAYVYFKFNSKSEIKILHLEFDKSFVPIAEKEGKIIMNRVDEDAQRYLELLCENGKVYGYIIDDNTELIWEDPCALEAMKEQYSRSIRPFNEWRILGDGSIGFHVVAGEGRAEAPEGHIGVHINSCPVEDWYYAETITVKDVPESFFTPQLCAKPVIYLYPEETIEVEVQLDYNGELTCTYPKYDDGWKITAEPDGTLTDSFGQTYNYLYWEGVDNIAYDFSRGFCVAGEDTSSFLEEVLAKLGLTRREANEFIIYWLPLMEKNPYNLIAFQRDVYTENAELKITPTPDTLLRVFMAWKPLEEDVEIEPQKLTTIDRKGFTVVEWGGTKVN